MNTVVFDFSGVIHIRPPNNAYCMDCMEAMRQMPDKAFELAIVDPPYGIGNFIPSNISRTGRRASAKVTWNDKTPSDEYFEQLERISKERIIWGANYYNCFSSRGGAVVWNKGDANPIFSQCEIASLSFQKRVDYININWQSGFHRENIEHVIHPCQKPVALYEWLLKNYAKPGDKILDTHLGSGSSRIAAYNMGFEFVGYEIDEDYFKAQEERFQAHISQMTFDDLQEATPCAL